MNTIYQVNANEIDQGLLASIKAALKDKEIEITVNEFDETEYLLRSPANRDSLIRAVKDIEEGRNIITPDQDEF